MRLACPIGGCSGRFEVSEIDPDSTLDDVLAHLRSGQHNLQSRDAVAMLAEVQRAPDDLL